MMDPLTFAVMEQVTLGRNVEFQFLPGPYKFMTIEIRESLRGWAESVHDQHRNSVEVEVPDPRRFADPNALGDLLARYVKKAGRELDEKIHEPGLTR